MNCRNTIPVQTKARYNRMQPSDGKHCNGQALAVPLNRNRGKPRQHKLNTNK